MVNTITCGLFTISFQIFGIRGKVAVFALCRANEVAGEFAEGRAIFFSAGFQMFFQSFADDLMEMRRTFASAVSLAEVTGGSLTVIVTIKKWEYAEARKEVRTRLF